jgi:hypothetical protein
MDLKEYYSNTLIIQYHEKPKAIAEIQLGASTFSGDWVIGDIPPIVDVDTSVGVQLDMIGKIVGVPRVVQGFVPDGVYYSYNDENNPMSHPEGKGMSDIGSPVRAEFKDYEDVKKSMYTISDGLYRSMIKLKILKNNSNATLKDIDNGLYEVFGGGITITDHFDMTGTVVVSSEYNLVGRLAAFMNIFPRPLGVSLTYQYL